MYSFILEPYIGLYNNTLIFQERLLRFAYLQKCKRRYTFVFWCKLQVESMENTGSRQFLSLLLIAVSAIYPNVSDTFSNAKFKIVVTQPFDLFLAYFMTSVFIISGDANIYRTNVLVNKCIFVSIHSSVQIEVYPKISLITFFSYFQY